LIEEGMRVGPKGQVVIPAVFRKALKISPGSKVVFKLENEKVILEKQSFDAAAAFEQLAKKGKSIKYVPSHLYEEEFDQRYKF
jgi:AbrB family looped-hinge helix DNA binding protein